MKILQITYSLSSGGAERFVVDLSNELSKTHEVHLVAILDDEVGENGFYREEISNKVKYRSLKHTRGFSFLKLISLYKIVREIDPDIVHFQGVNIIFFFLHVILFDRRPKYIETLHSKADVIFTLKRLSFITKLIYRSGLVHLCTISKANQESVERVCGIYDTTLVYNARALPLVSDGFESVKREIETFKKSNADKVFIHIGRFSELKNQEMLVRAFNSLDKKGYDFTLLIFGSGFDEALDLKKIACHRIHFLGVKHNITDYLMCADAFCLTSLVEGMPISLIEALYCGCYPICTPVSGPIDVIQDAHIGMLSSSFDEKSYIKVLELFLHRNDGVNREKLRQFALSMFSIEGCASNYLSVYKKRNEQV